MAKGVRWSKEREEELTSLFRQGLSTPAIAQRMETTIAAVRSKFTTLGLRYSDRDEPTREGPTPEQAAYPEPGTLDLLERIARLEGENARLHAQLTWAQHGSSETRTGGVLTIRRSDDHIADKNHLLQSCMQCEEKTLVLIEQYQPDRIQLLWGDDLIAGRGIYKEQDLDSATSSPEEQCEVGAVRLRRYLSQIRSRTEAPILSVVLPGNHNFAGTTPLTPLLFLLAEKLSRDIPGVEWRQGADRNLINLAAEGTYNALVTHGFGHSNQSPNSSAFIDSMKDAVIRLGRTLQPEEQIRRIVSGHTHWLSTGLERIIDLPFDTTGGFQRNTRVKLGMNQRPSGFLAYVSLPGMSDILKPIEVRPNQETYDRELDSVHLAAENSAHVAECLREARKLKEAWTSPAGIGGVVMEGRW